MKNEVVCEQTLKTTLFLMIYFAKVSLTYMPTGPCGPSMPGFPVKP